ncbi:MAG: hypothetical protein JO154_19325 [Chitinophaga sp.]|uniref:hypothetical protein n=1 Tax=Chitinophaga sp. TaxID=1869181 RepID=UPI0025C315D9|nr:hypothetical protein [Chitinophaga sp.]MBV8254761.1 hypothetical protein [Chitinophaga sp.]
MIAIKDTLHKVKHLMEVEIPGDKRIHSTPHIFHEVMEYCRSYATPQEMMDMRFHFVQYEKCLDAARGKDLQLSQYWLDYVATYPLEIGEVGKMGIGILEYPTKAFHAYASRDYSAATAHMKTSLEVLDSFYQHGFIAAGKAKLEQTLNLYKVYMKGGDFTNAISTATHLLNFVCCNRQNEGFQQNMEIMFKDNPVGWAHSIKWYSDKVIKELLYIDASTQRKIISALVDKVDLSACSTPSLVGAWKMLAAYNDAPSAFIAAFIDCPEFDRLAISIQYLLLQRLSTIVAELNPEAYGTLTDYLDSYYKQFPAHLITKGQEVAA